VNYLDCLMDRLMKEIATYLAFVDITRKPVTPTPKFSLMK